MTSCFIPLQWTHGTKQLVMEDKSLNNGQLWYNVEMLLCNKNNNFYTTLTNFSTKYLVMCKVYTDVGGIKQLYHVCPPVCKIIYSLMLVDYLHVQADNPWYNYYIITSLDLDPFYV